MTEWFAISDGIGRTVRLHAGPTSEAAARSAAEDVRDGAVVDKGSLELLTLVGGYDLEDCREAITDGGMSYFRFQERTILEPGRWITIRVALERDLDVGDRVALIDEDDLAFAFATIQWVARMRADDVAYHDFAGYPTFTTTADFLVHIRPYYPDRSVGPETVVDVVALENIVATDTPRPFPLEERGVITGP